MLFLDDARGEYTEGQIGLCGLCSDKGSLGLWKGRQEHHDLHVIGDLEAVGYKGMVKCRVLFIYELSGKLIFIHS